MKIICLFIAVFLFISCNASKKEQSNKESSIPIDRSIDKQVFGTGRAEREREIRRQIEEEKAQNSGIIQFEDMKGAFDNVSGIKFRKKEFFQNA